MKSSLPIGDAAARFSLPTNVLRHWEEVGLLRPERDGGGRRRYGDDDLVRIGVIVRSKNAGMSLEQIGVLLDEQAPERHRVLEEHLADLERRMADMERSRRMTEHALRCRSHDITTCPRFRAIMDEVVAGTGRWREAEEPVESARVSTDRGVQGREAASAR
ncbi:DNA-binding transcriptional MerR regulator [Microbacterium trichothecenolyticum]|uniref:MerR family transcriptional regulator n=1 Tax=Microbacterium trichothecenolyticum TaxID=69370 RepID=UPI002866A003|nr:MerR family transcriptional regulator [Microbacterium trichothecenolyticum]MDR7184057.1 DNA-binding transcriptional MerR regulator [Microbacterium trichothecenolyticum]